MYRFDERHTWTPLEMAAALVETIGPGSARLLAEDIFKRVGRQSYAKRKFPKNAKTENTG